MQQYSLFTGFFYEEVIILSILWIWGKKTLVLSESVWILL